MQAPTRVMVVHADDASMDQVLAGINDHRRERTPWHLRQQYNLPRNPDELRDILAWRPDGIISLKALPATLLAGGIPWVSVRHRQSPYAVMLDDQAIGRLAGAHLAGLGASSVAYLRQAEDEGEHRGWRLGRREGFCAEVARHGIEAHLLSWNRVGAPDWQGGWLLGQLERLARPVAIFAGNDHMALELFELLVGAGWRVPADAAVLGADDVPRCAACAVPISSVQAGHRTAGRLAAGLLADLLDGRVRSPTVLTAAPEGVSIRASTEAIGVQDAEVAAVLRFIRAHAAEPFTVADAVSASSLSRRSIELRFRTLLGRSILEEIHRQRIERACALFADPARTVAEVALDCGFTEAPHFTVVFRKVMGMTPSAWRSAHGHG